MSDFNQITIMGRLTRDPTMSFLPSNVPVVEIDLAVNRRWGSGDQKKESVCYISCRAFGKAAETLNKYMRKGNPLLVSGHLEQDRWEDKDDVKRSKHRIFIREFMFIGQGEKKEAQPIRTPEPQKEPETEYTPDGHEIPF